MSEFTKGKWYLDNDKENIYVIYENEEDGQKRRVYVAAAWAEGIHDGEVEANARLITGAPEMYNLLQNFSKGGGCFQCNFECRVRAKRLLARIDGEEVQE